MAIDRRLLSTALLMLVAAGWTIRAQDAPPALRTVKSLKCDFRQMATGTWGRDGAPTGQVKAASLSVGFSDIDTEVGSAKVDGSLGALYVVVQASGGNLHIMQVGSVGFLHATTVFATVNRPGKVKAVHSRHEYTDFALPGYTSRPEQYYGECEIRQ